MFRIKEASPVRSSTGSNADGAQRTSMLRQMVQIKEREREGGRERERELGGPKQLRNDCLGTSSPKRADIGSENIVEGSCSSQVFEDIRGIERAAE